MNTTNHATNCTNYKDVIKYVIDTNEFECHLSDDKCAFIYKYFCDGGDDIFGDGIEIEFGIDVDYIKLAVDLEDWMEEDYEVYTQTIKYIDKTFFHININHNYISDVNCEVVGDVNDWCDSYITEATYHNPHTPKEFAREMTDIELEHIHPDFVYEAVLNQIY
jgi:hypothetical protein